MALPAVSFYSRIKSIKGEDTLVEIPELKWRNDTIALFAVFDGHGGKPAAVLCKDQLENTMSLALDAEFKAIGQPEKIDVFDLLPNALKRCFLELDQKCCLIDPACGTTATVVVVAPALDSLGRWARLCVANVGDSHAYLKIGSRLIRLSEDHRLDASTFEQQRIASAGGEVVRRGSNPKEYPLRQWPGGLMMGRTLGDPEAIHSIGEPSVYNVMFRLFEAVGSSELPLSYRLILASDGLWDAMTAKSAFNSADKFTGEQAAVQQLVKEAVKRAGKHRDDISIVMLDINGTEEKILRHRASSTVCSINPIQQFETFQIWESHNESAVPSIIESETLMQAEIDMLQEESNRVEEERMQLESVLLQSSLIENQSGAKQELEEWEEVKSKRKDSISDAIVEPEIPIQKKKSNEMKVGNTVVDTIKRPMYDFVITGAKTISKGQLRTYFEQFGSVGSLVLKKGIVFLLFKDESTTFLEHSPHAIGDIILNVRTYVPKKENCDLTVNMEAPSEMIVPTVVKETFEKAIDKKTEKAIGTKVGKQAEKAIGRKTEPDIHVFARWNIESDVGITRNELQNFFEKFGKISRFYVKFENRRKGFAKIGYEDPTCAEAVLESIPDFAAGGFIQMKRYINKAK